MITEGHADETDIVSLLGVCSFAETQTSGGSGSILVKGVRNAMKRGSSSQGLLDALAALRDHTTACVPRVVRLAKHSRPAILLTDAAADETSVTLGACLFDPEQRRARVLLVPVARTHLGSVARRG